MNNIWIGKTMKRKYKYSLPFEEYWWITSVFTNISYDSIDPLKEFHSLYFSDFLKCMFFSKILLYIFVFYFYDLCLLLLFIITYSWFKNIWFCQHFLIDPNWLQNQQFCLLILLVINKITIGILFWWFILTVQNFLGT